MNEQLTEDWLDAKLREEAPYIDDDGFTARLVQQLPVRRRQPRHLRAAILLGATLVASIIAYLISGGGAFFANAAEFMVAMPFLTICGIALLCGLLITAAGASAAFLKAR